MALSIWLMLLWGTVTVGVSAEENRASNTGGSALTVTTAATSPDTPTCLVGVTLSREDMAEVAATVAVAVSFVLEVPLGQQITGLSTTPQAADMVLTTCEYDETTTTLPVLLDGAVTVDTRQAFLPLLRVTLTPGLAASVTLTAREGQFYCLSGDGGITAIPLADSPLCPTLPETPESETAPAPNPDTNTASEDETPRESLTEPVTTPEAPPDPFPETDPPPDTESEIIPETHPDPDPPPETEPSPVSTSPEPSDSINPTDPADPADPPEDLPLPTYLGCQETAIREGTYAVRFLFLPAPVEPHHREPPVVCQGGGSLTMEVFHTAQITAHTPAGAVTYQAEGGFLVCTYRHLAPGVTYRFTLYTAAGQVEVCYQNGGLVEVGLVG